MSVQKLDSKKIAKNTLYMYGRMFLSLLISLFTARIVLQKLGVEDYGIYNVVGGVVTMLAFINGSLSIATSRFITIELGKGDKLRLRETFNAAFLVHLLLALCLVLVCETFGLWFLNEKLVISAERMFSAHVVYQISIVSMFIGIIQMPYNACIAAHERFGIYAYMDILSQVLRLLVIFSLVYFSVDKLILFGALNLLTGILMFLIYWVYCKKQFSECRINLMWKPEVFKPILTFSGFDMYGNLSNMARSQGVNMLLNMFFGAIMNAAAGIATVVQNAVVGFSNNVLTAITPQITKLYAAKNYKDMSVLINNAIKLNILLLSFISLPLICEMSFILKIWYGKVPNYTDLFCIFTLLFNIAVVPSSIAVKGIHATGKIKLTSVINGTLYLLVIPVTYFSFKLTNNPLAPYIYNVLSVIVGSLVNCYLVSKYIKVFSFINVLLRSVLPAFLCLGIAYAGVYVLRLLYPTEGVVRLILTTIETFSLSGLLGYYFLISKELKVRAIKKIKHILGIKYTEITP